MVKSRFATNPQALTPEQINALEWPTASTSEPAWDRTVATPYGVAWVAALDGYPSRIRKIVAELEDGSHASYEPRIGWKRRM